jgi:hypothetical protein
MPCLKTSHSDFLRDLRASARNNLSLTILLTLFTVPFIITSYD